MPEYDVVVAGAGHNSLVTAAYLARAGLRCLVLEACPQVGGDAATDELTLPGFRHDTCSTAHNLIQASPLLGDRELPLELHGLEYIKPDPVVHMPFPDGTWLTQWRDLDRTCEEIARFSVEDASGYRRLLSAWGQVGPLVGRHRNTPAGWGPPLEELLPAEWRSRLGLSAWDVVREHFHDPHVRAFMLWMSFMTMQPPGQLGTALNAYSLVAGRQQHSWTLPRGGSIALPHALASLVEAEGGTVLTGRRVIRLLLDGGRCIGVQTADGDEHRGRLVLSSIHVKQLVEMAPAGSWSPEFWARVESWQAGVSMFVAHYALAAAPVFQAAGMAVVASGIAPSVERLLRIGPDFKQGRVAAGDPPLLVLCPTVADPSRAPEGRHTLKVIGFQPYELAAGPERWDELKAGVAAANLEQLRRYVPDLSLETILAEAIKSPLDLERFNANNWHGTCHGGYRCQVDVRTPIPGLYQTGSTTHPGGSVSAAPGRNAAMVVLSDLGIVAPPLALRAQR
jgi:phytoene dehydrogenase-like protein